MGNELLLRMVMLTSWKIVVEVLNAVSLLVPGVPVSVTPRVLPRAVVQVLRVVEQTDAILIVTAIRILIPLVAHQVVKMRKNIVVKTTVNRLVS
ncbi:hypothetical protein F4X88_21735 [Candidatus Poribacteria bacterium]|nr:hypothetical protein [Candidatus Poribacteria bacterium]MYA58905.1 hypothetical protein [Candidatus Poribacteria bacterium]